MKIKMYTYGGSQERLSIYEKKVVIKLEQFIDSVIEIISVFSTGILFISVIYLPWCVGKWIKAKANYHNARAEYINKQNKLI